MSFPYSDDLIQLIKLAIYEDQKDLTSLAIFANTHKTQAKLIAKASGIICGLPLIDLIFKELKAQDYSIDLLVAEASKVEFGTCIAQIEAQTSLLMQAERIILNFLCHLSGVATLTATYVEELQGTGVKLLDTRKTLPAFRTLEKYAVASAGAKNHRMSLSDMLMLKDNHIDAAGSITKAFNLLKSTYNPCPPIEIECRTFAEVQEALALKPARIMLDNMTIAQLQDILPQIPQNQELEISGQVNLENIRNIATCSTRRPNYISVGRITHSAPSLDLSLII